MLTQTERAVHDAHLEAEEEARVTEEWMQSGGHLVGNNMWSLQHQQDQQRQGQNVTGTLGQISQQQLQQQHQASADLRGEVRTIGDNHPPVETRPFRRRNGRVSDCGTGICGPGWFQLNL